ncbi:flavin-containing monooxygenase [Sneathiella chinensis]|uniref:Monooxygenase n=1 Tax=Sneathiella chinensis TaxID=349750 RepID=A0ABQ5U5E9_9PROT|nr:NAD(P)/FAD-dependent oxidoreductase [Sneathiella chinensis]GLQ06905.1 monooxygenase [Sneathiella chinensis]
MTTENSLQGATDADLKSALDAANIPTLMMVLTQLTGDRSLFSDGQVPSRSLEGVRRISEERQKEIRDQAFHTLRDLRDGKLTPPPLPSKETLRELLSLYVGEPVGAEFVPMFLEDMGFIDPLTTHIQWQTPQPQARKDDYSCLIIGSGMSGICMAIHLKQAGIPFTLIEKNDRAGGTWYQNTYPACGVDTPNHFYSFSFAPNADWSGYYSKRDELFAYLLKVADAYGITPHIQFNTTVTEASYDEAAHRWQVTVQDPDGSEQVLDSRFLISATGQLNRPSVPDFPGKETFKGPAFHSAEWRQDVDLSGKRVAVIGTGASAMQLCPAIAPEVAELTIFQRSKHWIRILPDYHRTVSDAKKWLLRHVPFYQNWYRFKLFWGYGDGLWESLKKDPDWPHPERAVNAENDRHRQIYVRHLEQALDRNPELMDKVIPDYPPFSKRMLIDNYWCEMLKRDNVDLVSAGVDRLTAEGIVDTNGDARDFDAIIYATGFKAGELLFPMTLQGRGGVRLHDQWQDDPRAYLGMTTPGFPNMFILYGPNTNLAHGGSTIFQVECQTRYITKSIMGMIEADRTELEIRKDIHDEYNRTVDDIHNGMIWTHPDVGSWYKNSEGRIVANTPWRLVDYWSLTYDTDLTKYHLAG